MLEFIYCFSSYCFVVFEFLPLQTCINGWAESLETPSHLCLGGPGAGTGDWHMENLYPKPVFRFSTGPVFSRIPVGIRVGVGKWAREASSASPHLHQEKSHSVQFPQ